MNAKRARELEQELLRILDQGTTAVQRVVAAYVAQRTRERDLHWLALQAGKEFQAITLQNERAVDAVRLGRPHEVPKWAAAMQEEYEHYHGYLQLLEDASSGTHPVPEMYHYFLVRVSGGRYAIDPLMEVYRDRWPDNYQYFAENIRWINEGHPWLARLTGAQFEGAAVGWHWAMSQLPPVDEFFRREAALEAAIVADELHHGPEEIRELARAYPEGEVDLEECLRVLRELRYLEVRQRNEQYLHPLREEELHAIGEGLRNDTLPPTPLFAESLRAD